MPFIEPPRERPLWRSRVPPRSPKAPPAGDRGFWTQEHPAARIVVRTGLTAELYDEVLHGRLDVAMCLHPAFALPKTLHWLLLREERLVVLAPQAWAHRDPHELLRDEALEPWMRRLTDACRYTMPGNETGLPAISIPAAITTRTWTDTNTVTVGGP